MEKFDVVGSDVPATETVLIRNSGWTLLYVIPGLFGDVTWDPKANDGKGGINGGLCFFRDKCNVKTSFWGDFGRRACGLRASACRLSSKPRFSRRGNLV